MPSTVWSSIVSRLGGNKRAAEEEEDARPAKSRKTKEPSKASYAVTPRQLVMLGGFWEGVPPFNGDEDRRYRWLAEPALWARLVMNDLEPRVQQRIVQLHAGIHDGLDASGLSVDLPRVTIKQLQFLPSSHFGEGWEARSFAGPPASAAATPPWLRNARRLVQDATFSFLGAPMPVVDEGWSNDRFSRQDTIVHALCCTGGSSSSSSTEVPPSPRRGGRHRR